MAFGPKVQVIYNPSGKVSGTRVAQAIQNLSAKTSKPAQAVVETIQNKILVFKPQGVTVVQVHPQSRALVIALRLIQQQGWKEWAKIEVVIREAYGTTKTQNYIDKNCRKTKQWLINKGYKITE